MSNNLGIGIALAVVIVIIVGIVYVVIPDGEGDGSEGGMEFNGQDFSWEELSEDLETKTVDGKEGLGLSDILNKTSFGDELDDDKNETLFTIMAEDGWQKNVSWVDMMRGILLEEDSMTHFPHLTSAYKVKYVVSINKIDLGPLALVDPSGSWDSSVELTWDGLFEDLTATSFTSGADTYDGINLTAVLEHAGFTDLANHTYTITGVDGYSKDVNWTSVQNGYLVLDNNMSVFPDLTNKYKIRNIIRIEVVEI